MSILIIGAGIGGLALANALQRKGIEYKLYERAPALRAEGAGITLWANAMRMLEHIGLADEVRQYSLEDFCGTISTWQGKCLLRQSPEDMRRNYGEFVALHRSDLIKVLRSHLDDSSLHTSQQFHSYSTEGEKLVARFSNGQSEQLVEGRCLVGCDGLHSAVRAQMLGEQKPLYSGYTCWCSVIAFPHERLLPGEQWGSGARFGQVPLGNGLVYWFATKNAPEAQRAPQGEKQELQKIFGNWHPSVRELIEVSDDEHILRNDIYDRQPLDRWSNGCLTLLGDAAHPMTPNLGQGGCQALEDAVVLAECLAKEKNIKLALKQYEVQRSKRTRVILLQSRTAGDIAQWEQPFAVWLRNSVFKVGLNAIFAKRVSAIVNAEISFTSAQR